MRTTVSAFRRTRNTPSVPAAGCALMRPVEHAKKTGKCETGWSARQWSRHGCSTGECMQAIGFRMPDDRDVGDGITSALTLCFLPRDFPVEPRRRHGAGSWQTYLAETADKWRRLTATAPSPTDGSLGCVDRSNSPSMSQETEDQACRLGDWQRGRDVELLAVSRRWHTIVWPAWPKPMVQVRPHDSVVFRAGALFVSRSTCPKALCCVGRSKSAGRRQFAVDEASNGQDSPLPQCKGSSSLCGKTILNFNVFVG